MAFKRIQRIYEEVTPMAYIIVLAIIAVSGPLFISILFVFAQVFGGFRSADWQGNGF